LATSPTTRGSAVLKNCADRGTTLRSPRPIAIARASNPLKARATNVLFPLDSYRAVRHLLIGAWYPLLPYSRSRGDWMASQYHRPDLDEGVIIALRRPESPYLSVELALRGLDPEAIYELAFDSSGSTRRVTGGELTKGFPLTIAERQRSELIVYRRVAQ
jgi:hypothetical protein